MINNPPKKIVVDLTPMLPGGDNGGAKIFVIELLKQLASVASGTEFILLTRSHTHDELAHLDRPNMRRLLVDSPIASDVLRRLIKRFAPYAPNFLKAAANRYGYPINLALKRLGSKSIIKEIGADLLFCPFTAPTFYSAGVPTVCVIYDLLYKSYPEFFFPEDVAYRNAIFTEACLKADALLTISNFSKSEAITFGKIPPSKISTIYIQSANRLHSQSFSNQNLLSRLGIVSQRFLLYPANFWKHKNHEMLINAFKLACQKNFDEDIKLVCTGSANVRRDSLIKLALKSGMADRILFQEYVSNSDLAILMSHSAGVIFPSLYEGFGMPVVEAMASGTPVACSNTASLPEIAGDAAILFDPHDPVQIAQAMISLVNDETLRRSLIQAGLQRAVAFSNTENAAREYWEKFQNIQTTMCKLQLAS